MINLFQVKNYKALRDVSVHLTPIHVLIGPNDSGKTSIFEALTALHHTLERDLRNSFLGTWQGSQLVWQGDYNSPVSFKVTLNEINVRIDYEIVCKFSPAGREVAIAAEQATSQGKDGKTASLYAGNPICSGVFQGWQSPGSPNYSFTKPIHDALESLHSYKWVPYDLSLPVSFNFSPSPRFSMGTSGFGLSTLLNDILGEDHVRFGQLEARFRKIFPDVARLRLRREAAYQTLRDQQPSVPGWALYFELATKQGQARQGNGDHDPNGLLLPAWQASDGLLLVLAYLAILYSPQPPRLLLVEEPENGIHPQRLTQVLNILKELVKEQNQTQVILTTHSPYVVDQFQPEEVTLCVKGTDGAVTTHRLSESKPVREQIDIFQLGEIWTAEGDEALAEQATSH
jgi:predicted ATPase